MIKEFRCKTCDKTYTTKGRLNNHILSIHKEIGEKCRLCDNFFENSKNLKQHIKNYHQKTFCGICKQCDKQFFNRISFSRHKNEKHGSNKSNKLQFDNNQEENKANDLKHTSPKQQMICSICGVSFDKSFKILVHYQLKHSDQEKFKCEICG